MHVGHFYFLTDQYGSDFPNAGIMTNKPTVDGVKHGRPCFYSFEDSKTGLFWMIPVSSQISKYQAIYQSKISKYKTCDTIVFGNLLGQKSAFLIQNICPVTQKYINNEYLDKNNTPVRIPQPLEKELQTKARKVIALVRKGIHGLVFTDILEIEKELLKEINPI